MCTLLAVEISRMGNEDYEVKNKFSHVISELERNFLEDIDWQELASKTHYSYEHFRHLFKAFYGVSPKQYVRTLRLEHAKRLLSNEKNYTSTYICEICKFSNYNRFRTLFKAETGLSPNQYRKKMQGDFLY